MTPPAISRPDGVTGRQGGKLHEVAESEASVNELARDLERARVDLAASTEAREKLSLEAQELVTQSALTRERLSARLAEVTADSEALRAEAARLRGAAAQHAGELAHLRGELKGATAERDQARRQLASQQEAAHDQRLKLEAELRDVYRAREQSVQELIPERAALAAAREAHARLTGRLERHAAETAELDRRLALRTEELDAAVSRLAFVEGSTGALERAITELRAETTEVRSERARLAARVDTLTLHGDGLMRAVAERDRAIGEYSHTLAERQRALSELGAQVEALGAESERREARIHALQEELQAGDHRREALELERRRTIEDLRRVGASRAWRWGHGTSRLLRRLTFRRSRGKGGVEKLLERLDPPASLPAPDEAPAATEQL
jgi:chromosome segregation ATPase